LPKLEIVSSFGVGYDHVDAKWAGAHGIIVTNTPDVLTEEVADTALGLLDSTPCGEFPQAERLPARRQMGARRPIRSARRRCATAPSAWSAWARIGRAIAQAASTPSACRWSIIRGGSQARARLPALSRTSSPWPAAVDVLLVIVPGGAETRNMINAAVLEALGPDGILINIARGSVVDEPALIAALRDKKIRSAGLDVFVNEPKVPKELMEMDNVVLFPHLGSASVYTRTQMDHLVVDNLLSWAAGKGPLTPVPETPPK
jgi:lactate dehydrogenase-like 2-hydroxyacid dehydrogenase